VRGGLDEGHSEIRNHGRRVISRCYSMKQSGVCLGDREFGGLEPLAVGILSCFINEQIIPQLPTKEMVKKPR